MALAMPHPYGRKANGGKESAGRRTGIPRNVQEMAVPTSAHIVALGASSSSSCISSRVNRFPASPASRWRRRPHAHPPTKRGGRPQFRALTNARLDVGGSRSGRGSDESPTADGSGSTWTTSSAFSLRQRGEKERVTNPLKGKHRPRSTGRTVCRRGTRLALPSPNMPSTPRQRMGFPRRSRPFGGRKGMPSRKTTICSPMPSSWQPFPARAWGTRPIQPTDHPSRHQDRTAPGFLGPKTGRGSSSW